METRPIKDLDNIKRVSGGEKSHLINSLDYVQSWGHIDLQATIENHCEHLHFAFTSLAVLLFIYAVSYIKLNIVQSTQLLSPQF